MLGKFSLLVSCEFLWVLASVLVVNLQLSLLHVCQGYLLLLQVAVVSIHSLHYCDILQLHHFSTLSCKRGKRNINHVSSTHVVEAMGTRVPRI